MSPVTAVADTSALVAPLRGLLYALRARGLDAAGPRGIDYAAVRVQSSARADTHAPLGAPETRDPVQERLARIAARALVTHDPDLSRALHTLQWLRATAVVVSPGRRPAELRALLDAARTDADLVPVLLALAASPVAAAHVPDAARARWAASSAGACTWARAALLGAVAAWEAARPSR